MGTAKRERQKANRQIRLEEMARQVQKEKRKRGAIKWTTLIVVGTVVVIVIALVAGGKKKTDTTAADSPTPTTTPGDGPTTAAGAPTTSLDPTATSGAALTGATPCPNADGSSPRTLVFASAPPTCIDPAKTYTAVIETNKGSYTVTLDAAKAPKTVNNYVVLARYHYFDGTPCHRIISGFMAQCGDPSGSGTGDQGKYPGYSFDDENLPATNSYPKGTLAMANSGPNTNGSQYFTMLADYPLSPNYSVFGTVTDGLDTLTKLEAEADPNADNGVPPKTPVIITKVTITEK